MSETSHHPPRPPPPDESPTAGLARNAFFLVLGQVATTALAIFFNAALGRTLGATDFGLYFLVTTMSTFGYVVAEWGQGLFVIRLVAREPERSGTLLGTAIALRAGSALLLPGLTWVTAWVLGYDVRTQRFAPAFVLANLPFFLSQAFSLFFRGRDRMGDDAAISVTNKALAFLIALPALALGTGIYGVVGAQTVAGVGALGLAYVLYRRFHGLRLHSSLATARELIAGGTPILAMSAAVSVQPYLDTIILSKLVPAVAVGWFGAAKTILGTLTTAAAILGAAAYPRLSRAADDHVAFVREIRTALRPMLWLGALSGTGTFLFAKPVVALIYGSKGFGPAVTILQVFAPGMFLLFLDILLASVVYAYGAARGFAVVKILSVLVSSVLDFVLIPFFQSHYGNGGIGVVVAFAASEFVVFPGALLILRRERLGAGMGIDMLRALGAAGVTMGLFAAAPGLPWYVGIPACLVFFTGASMVLGLVSRNELSDLWSVLRRRSPRAAVEPP